MEDVRIRRKVLGARPKGRAAMKESCVRRRSRRRGSVMEEWVGIYTPNREHCQRTGGLGVAGCTPVTWAYSGRMIQSGDCRRKDTGKLCSGRTLEYLRRHRNGKESKESTYASCKRSSALLVPTRRTVCWDSPSRRYLSQRRGPFATCAFFLCLCGCFLQASSQHSLWIRRHDWLRCGINCQLLISHVHLQLLFPSRPNPH